MFLQGLEVWGRYPNTSAMRIMTDAVGMVRLALPGRSATDANQPLTCPTVVASTLTSPKASAIGKGTNGAQGVMPDTGRRQPGSAADVIRVDGLSKDFDGLFAVRDLDFSVAGGSTLALLGGNGAGKTTTISMLLGLVTPSAGRIVVLGADMRINRHAVLPLINFSSPYVDLPKRLTVRQNLRVYGTLYGVVRLREAIERIAEDLDLTAFLDRPYGQLSSGQRTRVGLAKSLLNRPLLLLLDEPTASLDPETADWVRAYLERYRESAGATMLIASHNMAEVERLCDDVVMMKAGLLVDRGTPASLIAAYGRDNLEEVFLDIAREPEAPGGRRAGP